MYLILKFKVDFKSTDFLKKKKIISYCNTQLCCKKKVKKKEMLFITIINYKYVTDEL